MATRVELYNGAVIGEWPDHVSSSQRSWWSCRLKNALSTAARLRFRESRPTKGLIAGSMLHSVLRRHYDRPPADRTENGLIHDLVAGAWLEQWPERLVNDIMVRCDKMLRKFWKEYGDDGWEPATEVKLTASLIDTAGRLEGVTYLGYADAVGTEPDQIIVEEWKTSLQKIEPDRYTLWNPQVVDYVWAVRQQYPEATVTLRYLFLTPGRVWRTEIPVINTDDTQAELSTLAVEQRTLTPAPNYGNHCKFCDYSTLCTLKITGGEVTGAVDWLYKKGG